MADGERQSRLRRRWQFGLAQLLAAVTGIAVVFGLFHWARWSLSAAAVCVVLLVLVSFLPARARRALLVVLLCTYLPYVWLLGDYPWHGYRWSWIGMWPLLPGLVPGMYLLHGYEYLEFPCMALASLLLVGVGTAVAAWRRWALLVTACVVLALSIANAWLAYAIYRA